MPVLIGPEYTSAPSSASFWGALFDTLCYDTEEYLENIVDGVVYSLHMMDCKNQGI